MRRREGRYWDGNGGFFSIHGRLGYGNGLYREREREQVVESSSSSSLRL